MLPLMPFSTLTRTKTFVTEEWDTYFSNGRVDQVAGGWRGILYANLAIIAPATSYNFFAQTNFDMTLLDGGASRTWYLAYSAALGGSPASAKRDVVERAEEQEQVERRDGQDVPAAPVFRGGRRHMVSAFLKKLSERAAEKGF